MSIDVGRFEAKQFITVSTCKKTLMDEREQCEVYEAEAYITWVGQYYSWLKPGLKFFVIQKYSLKYCDSR